MTKRYEICTYQYGIDAAGDHQHIDGVPNPSKTGFTVYVREYEVGNDETWDEVFDEDFDTQALADAAIAQLQAKYPGAGLDAY